MKYKVIWDADRVHWALYIWPSDNDIEKIEGRGARALAYTLKGVAAL